jgi:hypothetical protein
MRTTKLILTAVLSLTMSAIQSQATLTAAQEELLKQLSTPQAAKHAIQGVYDSAKMNAVVTDVSPFVFKTLNGRDYFVAKAQVTIDGTQQLILGFVWDVESDYVQGLTQTDPSLFLKTGDRTLIARPSLDVNSETSTPLSPFYVEVARSTGNALGTTLEMNKESVDSPSFKKQQKEQGVFMGLTSETDLDQFMKIGTEAAKSAINTIKQ